MTGKRYLEWLVAQVKGSDKPYHLLFEKLNTITYIWAEILDRDRAGKAVELRYEYGYTSAQAVSSATVLEVLVALARDMDDVTGEPGENHADLWFGMMLDNLGLSAYDDESYDEKAVQRIVDIWLNKSYDKNGRGGLFPLKHSFEDQRHVPIWNQACSYMNEHVVA
jgi:hypothetical protein